MSNLLRHGRLVLLLVVGIVAATLLVSMGTSANAPQATVGQAEQAISSQADDGTQVAQTTIQSDKDKDKDKGKCPTKPCPKARPAS
jgi:beta-lactam-binding protein with PASTA domain